MWICPVIISPKPGFRRKNNFTPWRAVHGTARPMRRDGGMTHTAPAFFLYWTGKACGDGDDQDVRIISLYDGAVEWYYYLMKDWYHWYPDSADGAPVVVCVP